MSQAGIRTVTVFFRLDQPLPTVNTMIRKSRWADGKMLRALAKKVWEAIMAVPGQSKRGGLPPFARAKVHIVRRSVGAPDPDGVWVKHLLDVLQPPSKRHPYGLGILANDTDECLCGGAEVIREKVDHRVEQCTMVTILGEAEC